MSNLYREYLALLPAKPVQIGTVASRVGGVATINLPGGGITQARGDATVGQRVFVCDGNIQGPAPVLTYVEAEV